jgi:hypothetical protein
MFFGYLQVQFHRHAEVYRAITVEEYRNGIVYPAMVKKEFDAICQHWNRASQKVDMHSMAYTVELYAYISHLPHFNIVRSGWEFRRQADAPGAYMAAFAK